MGWEDRPYYRDRGSSTGATIWSALNGSIPLFTAFGIRVRVHMWLLFFIASTIIFTHAKNYDLQTRVTSMGMLFSIVLLHEFGHCFAARSVGGTAEDIMLWPLGGLAFTHPPRQPWPTFVTVAGGPLVNVLICLVCAIGVWAVGHRFISFNPFNVLDDAYFFRQSHNLFCYYLVWIYEISYILFLFNLLPIFPLDGGQMLQTALWPKLGHYRATTISYVVGMGGSIGLVLYGLVRLDLFIITIAILCFLYCRSHLIELRETGDESWGGGDPMDFSASLRPDRPRKRRRVSRWKMRRLRRQAESEVAEQERIDTILAKVSATGMASLTWSERRALRRATERQRRRELEMSREMRIQRWIVGENESRVSPWVSLNVKP